MSPKSWWAVTVVLAVLAGLLLLVVVPWGQTPISTRGTHTVGSVQMKDQSTDPANPGYAVTFLFMDTMHRNHQVTRTVANKGQWDSLRPGGDIKVYYLPEKPEEATIEGAAGMGSPHAAAFGFLGWTLVLAAAYTGFRAISAPKPAPVPDTPGRPKKIIVTRR